MSDILTIDTSVAAGIKQPEQKFEPLPVFDDKHPLLSEIMPEYVGVLPDREMTKIVGRLKVTMKLYSGLGLSANQCGIKQRVFVIGTDQFQMACINPKVIKVSEELVKDTEGCLSFPLLGLSITRPKEVAVTYQDYNGEWKQATFSGISARCFQHELDHLNGIVYTSVAKPMALQSGMKKVEKFYKKYFSPQQLKKLQHGQTTKNNQHGIR